MSDNSESSLGSMQTLVGPKPIVKLKKVRRISVRMTELDAVFLKSVHFSISKAISILIQNERRKRTDSTG
jgi:hypothetical protein